MIISSTTILASFFKSLFLLSNLGKKKTNKKKTPHPPIFYLFLLWDSTLDLSFLLYLSQLPFPFHICAFFPKSVHSCIKVNLIKSIYQWSLAYFLLTQFKNHQKFIFKLLNKMASMYISKCSSLIPLVISWLWAQLVSISCCTFPLGYFFLWNNQPGFVLVSYNWTTFYSLNFDLL